MAKTRLSKAVFVERGYGQVEPNHLSAQRTGQIYAQLPAAADIELLENGQFVKYDYANHEVNLTGAGEWMLVFNEVKVYRDFLGDQDFAMVKDNYVARVYSPIDGEKFEEGQSRFYGGKDAEGNAIEAVTKKADEYELDYNNDPFHLSRYVAPKLMKEGTNMVPRVFKTNVGDIYTTNCINVEKPEVGAILAPAADGYLAEAGEDATMKWQIAKIYDLADRQRAVKLVRIA